jgi:hypothetical protein
LLERLNALSGEGTLVMRKQALDALDKLPLREPVHDRTRDVCRNAHLELLNAETAQASARRSLEDATRQAQPGGGALPPERSQAIALELERSSEALNRAKQGFPECEEVTQKLVLKAR